MAKSPADIAQNWSQRMQSAGPAITAGVQAVTVAPGAAAARSADLWATNTAAAKAKYTKNVQSVGLQAWQEATINKGVQRIAAGAQAAQPKVEQFMVKLLPFIASVKGQLPPRGNLEQNIARSAAFSRGMAGFSNS